MVRLRIHEIMKARKIGRLHAGTLDELCRFFRLQPGALLKWVP